MNLCTVFFLGHRNNHSQVVILGMLTAKDNEWWWASNFTIMEVVVKSKMCKGEIVSKSSQQKNWQTPHCYFWLLQKIQDIGKKEWLQKRRLNWLSVIITFNIFPIEAEILIPITDLCNTWNLWMKNTDAYVHNLIKEICLYLLVWIVICLIFLLSSPVMWALKCHSCPREHSNSFCIYLVNCMF